MPIPTIAIPVVGTIQCICCCKALAVRLSYHLARSFRRTHRASASPAKPEQAYREKQTPWYSSIQPCFGDRHSRRLLIPSFTPQVQPICHRVYRRTYHCTNGNGKLDKSSLEDCKAVLGLVGGDDAAEEEEEYAPSERDPESEG